MIILANGSFEVKSATDINAFKNKFRITAANLARFMDTKDMNIFTNPSDTITANRGIAIILDIKNTRDRVLKLYIIMGISNICAEIVIDNPVIMAWTALLKILFCGGRCTPPFKPANSIEPCI